MTYYPVFIPISPGGGGPIHPAGVIVLLGITGGIYWIYNKNIRARVDLKLKYANSDKDMIYVRIKEYNYPLSVKSSIINGICLENKGYTINNAYEYKGYTISRRDGAPISKEEFMGDCKECDVKTAIQYKYTTIFLNSKKIKKEVAWQDTFKDKLE
jgi:hypothetical protein